MLETWSLPETGAIVDSFALCSSVQTLYCDQSARMVTQNNTEPEFKRGNKSISSSYI